MDRGTQLSQVQHVLEDAGYVLSEVDGSHRMFVHADKQKPRIVLPVKGYRVSQAHVHAMRRVLDESGTLPASKFDEQILATVGARGAANGTARKRESVMEKFSVSSVEYVPAARSKTVQVRASGTTERIKIKASNGASTTRRPSRTDATISRSSRSGELAAPRKSSISPKRTTK
jgi:predicted RNA binding protein YcfA (HicA-like mRNA interferase family)